MRVTRIGFVIVIWVLAIARLSAGAPDSGAGFDSFLEGVPEHWEPSRPGTLSTSEVHYKHGGQSLRWDWEAGDKVAVRRGLGDISRTGGYGGTYGKASFGVWLYQRDPVEGELRFEFQRDGETTAHFDFDLNFTGWRPAYLWFERDFEGSVDPLTDTIRLLAPENVPGGKVFVDLVVYNGILDYRAQRIPNSHRFEPDAWELRDELFPKPATLESEEREGVEELYDQLVSRLAGTGRVTKEFLQEVSTRIEEWEIVVDEDGVRGQPVVFRHTGFFEDEGVDGLTTPREIADLMREMGRRYHWSDDLGERDELGDAFILLARHLRDQGLEAGSGFEWAWYPGRSFAESLLLMRDVLDQEGMLNWAFGFMDYNYGVSDIFDDDTMGNPHMDYFHFDTRYRLYGILLLEEEREKVRHLRAFSRRLSADILLEDGPNGFKPDGSTWHHWGHYFAYAEYCVDTLVNVMHALSDTPFRVTPEAYDRVKEALLKQRLFANKRSVPLSLHGRHPFNYGRGQNLRVATFGTLAKANSYGPPENVDPELAAALLRLDPSVADEEPFKALDLEPEAHPNGKWTMNYAGISMHRRDDWLALAKGYSEYVWASEIYQRENRFGRYLSNGALEILAGGEPVNFHDSGYREEGWDWNRIDGTTVIYLPIDRLRAPRAGTEMIRSDHTFVGGLSHRGENGVFVMQLYGDDQHEPTFEGQKTYFFFGDRIVALGSGISNADTEHPTHTNLFQKHLPEPPATPIIVNGEPVADLPFREVLAEAGPNWLIDTQGTGYLLPLGQSVHVARQEQISRNHTDTEDTKGDFTTAWIDHGKAPSSGEYEYLIVPRADEERMKSLAANLSNNASRPYQVHQQDERAHIVHDRESGMRGAVFFEAQEINALGPVTEVGRPCLIMAEPLEGGRFHLSIADPDLNLDDDKSLPRDLLVTLRGEWNLERASDEVEATAASGTTQLVISAHQGRSFESIIAPAN